MTFRATSLSRRSAPLAMVLSAAALAAVAADADAAVTRATVAGPSADVAIPGNDRVDVDVAPDGSAAIAFRQKVGGVDHAFVSRYVGGVWSAPIRVDAGLASPSAAPVVSVGNGGRTLVAFPNGPVGNEKLYASYAPDAATAMISPYFFQGDPAGWKGLDLDVAANGEGYLTAYEGFHLWSYRVKGGAITPVGAMFPNPAGILNGAPGEQAESGDQHGAHVAVDATGATATIAWGENSGADRKIWARKLSGTAVGQIGAAVDATVPTLDGKPAVANIQDMSSVAVGGDGRAWVTWRAGFLYGAQNIGRALVRSFDGTTFGAPQVIDGLGAAPTESAEYPRVAANASGAGLAASYRQLTFGTEAATLPAGGAWSTGTTVSEGTNLAAGRSSVALADSGVGLVSMYSETTAGQGRVLGRVSGGPAAGTLETLSDPAFGPADLAAETGAGGGYAVTAFLQGTAATSRIVAAVVPLPTPAPPATPGPGTGTPPGPGTTPTGTTPAPTLTQLRLRKKTITATSAAPKLVSATSKKRTLSFTLDRPASVDLTVVRVRPGKLVGGTCVSAKGKPVARAKRCSVETAVKGAATLEALAGTTQVQFGGRATKGKALAAGSYALYAVARAPQGTAAPVRAAFTLRAKR